MCKPTCRLVGIVGLVVGLVVGKIGAVIGVVIVIMSGRVVPTEFWALLAATVTALAFLIYEGTSGDAAGRPAGGTTKKADTSGERVGPH